MNSFREQVQSRENRSTFGHPHVNYDKVWFEENDKQFKNVEGPGPGYYDLEAEH